MGAQRQLQDMFRPGAGGSASEPVGRGSGHHLAVLFVGVRASAPLAVQFTAIAGSSTNSPHLSLLTASSRLRSETPSCRPPDDWRFDIKNRQHVRIVALRRPAATSAIPHTPLRVEILAGSEMGMTTNTKYKSAAQRNDSVPS